MKVISDKLEDKEQLLLINKIYDLGFEVGYKNHSEVGWVLREYTKLMNEAQKLGLKSPEIYYNDGKTKGRASREGVAIGASEKGKNEVSTGSVQDSRTDVDDVQHDEDGDSFLKKPQLDELPHLVRKSSMAEIPKFLYGLKFFRKK